MKVLLSELDLPGVELPDPRDFVVLVDHCRGLTLCLGQDDVNKVLRRRHDSDFLEVIVCHLLKANHVVIKLVKGRLA